MELGTKHSLHRRNLATRRHGECDRPSFSVHVSDVAEPLELEEALLGVHNAEVLRECGH
jgi:hypothetical protein